MCQTFECLKCGRCCERIVIEQEGIPVGLCLLPGEQKVFEAFPGVVVPYVGLRKRAGKLRVEVVCYQMVQAPCPLYDRTRRQCTIYSHRPATCRAYPFSNIYNGYSVEQHCRWVKELGVVKPGETVVRGGDAQDEAVIEINHFFNSLHERMQRTGDRMVFYDVSSGVWLEPIRG